MTLGGKGAFRLTRELVSGKFALLVFVELVADLGGI